MMKNTQKLERIVQAALINPERFYESVVTTMIAEKNRDLAELEAGENAEPNRFEVEISPESAAEIRALFA